MSAGTSMNARAIAEQLLQIEQSLDLDCTDWSIEDTHLWPLYRLELYRLLFVTQAGPVNTSARRPDIGPALKRLKASSRDAEKPCRVWLVSDGISFATLGDGQVERFCSPLHDELNKLGVSSVVVDRGSYAYRSGTTPSRWWAPMTVRAKIRGALQAAMWPDTRHLRLIRKIELIAERAGIALPELSARRMGAMTNAVLSLAADLTIRMRRERVSAVFVVGYYDVGGYAYVLAARRSGAAAVDVQHGVTGPLHMAYADWTVEPTTDLTLLPDHFWCWAQDDAHIIEKWAPLHRRTAYRAVVGGHPFLEAWRKGSLRLNAAEQRMLDKMIQDATGGGPIILVALQPHLTSAESLEPLLQAWSLQPTATWWIRLHPLAATDRPQIESLLARTGVTHWNIDGATSLPLPVLMTESSLHATHSSSTVIEAELLGVPSAIWSTYGAQLFETHIRRGAATQVSDGASILRLLANIENSNATRSPTAPTPSLLPGALQAILKAAP